MKLWLLDWLERRKQRRRWLKELEELPKGPFPLDGKGEATGTFETVGKALDTATEEKKKARTTAQRLLDLLRE